jgi:hypothetical protein
MPTYSKIEERLFTARLADSAAVNSGTSYSGDAVDLPGAEKMAAIPAPVAIFKCDAAGSPGGGTFCLQVQSKESGDWISVPGAIWNVSSSAVLLRGEIGNLGAATKMRLYGYGLSGLSGSNCYTVTASVEGALA